MKMAIRITVCVLALACVTVESFEKESDTIDWLRRLSEKGQTASLRAKAETKDFKNIFSEDKFNINNLRKSSVELMDTGIPSKMGYGFMMGYTSGFCLKKISKVVAFIVGCTFMMLQGLSYQGYVSLNHLKLREDLENILDVNGDGVINTQDVVGAYRKLYNVMSHNIPAGSGFAGGMILGIRG